jgi:hypothetical protein
MHAWQFGQSFEINERFGGIVHVSRRQLEAYNNDNIQYIVQVYDTRNFIWYMDNQMEVLNLSFISFMHLNNDFSAFFVIYLPVINASMKSRPMSLTITWPPSLNRAVGRSFWLGGGSESEGRRPEEILNLESLKRHFLDFGEDLTQFWWSEYITAY